MVKNNNDAVDDRIKQEILDEVGWASDVALELCKAYPELITSNMRILELIKFVLERKDTKK